MKKPILLIAIYLLSCFAKADEPLWVNYILSNNSTVWVAVNIPDIVYRITFDCSGKIYWDKENDSVLCNKLKNKYYDDIKIKYQKTNHTQLEEISDKEGKLWSIKGEWSKIENKNEYYLCFCESNLWKKVCQVPASSTLIY